MDLGVDNLKALSFSPYFKSPLDGICFFYVFDTGVSTQGLMLAKHTHYHLSHSISSAGIYLNSF
jgi:hypothetical protein